MVKSVKPIVDFQELVLKQSYGTKLTVAEAKKLASLRDLANVKKYIDEKVVELNKLIKLIEGK